MEKKRTVKRKREAATKRRRTVMRTNLRKQVYWLIACVAIIAFASIMGYLVKHDFGKVDVKFVRIMDDSGMTVAAKIYRHKTITPENKAPYTLMLHSY